MQYEDRGHDCILSTRVVTSTGRYSIIFVESLLESEVAQLCSTLCNPMDYSLPGSSVHGIFQARVLEWGAIAFSRRSY